MQFFTVNSFFLESNFSQKFTSEFYFNKISKKYNQKILNMVDASSLIKDVRFVEIYESEILIVNENTEQVISM